MSDLLLGLGAYAGLAVLDFVWAIYTVAVARGQPLRAGVAAIGIYMLGAVVMVHVVQDNWLIIPACAGAFTGTFLSVKRLGTS